MRIEVTDGPNISKGRWPEIYFSLLSPGRTMMHFAAAVREYLSISFS